MRRSIGTLIACSFSSALLVALSACTAGDVAVGETNKTGQQLKRQADGSPTGDGQTCSWKGTAGYDAASPSAQSSYAVGATFASLDGCNECSCSSQGIMCTVRACQQPKGCTLEAKQCPDGSSVGRTGPNCEFAACPTTPKACTEEAKQCPDGSYVGRGGPNCEFAPCPTEIACPNDAQICPDGSTSVRTGPKCEFTECPAACTPAECGPAPGMPNYLCPDGTTWAGPGACKRTNGKCGYEIVSCPSGGKACAADAKLCPDGSYVARTGPSCEFAPCP